MKDLTSLSLKELEDLLTSVKILLDRSTDKDKARQLRNDRSRLNNEIRKRKSRKNPQ